MQVQIALCSIYLLTTKLDAVTSLVRDFALDSAGLG
jgi:hypothetical protein